MSHSFMNSTKNINSVYSIPPMSAASVLPLTDIQSGIVKNVVLLVTLLVNLIIVVQ